MRREIERTRTVIVDTSDSPACRLHPVPLEAVELTGGFLARRVRTNRETTIPVLLERLREHHALDDFRRLYGASDREFSKRLATGSDVYKWLQGACYALANRPDPELERSIEEVVEVILPAQEESGYLNVAFGDRPEEERWQEFHGHELYSAGHLMEAAVSHRRATGRERLLEAAVRLADYLWERFGPDGRRWYPGHPEVELALVELYRETGRERYRRLARCFLERNEHVDPAEIRGHAVRGLYYACGMTDLCAETGDEELRRVVGNHWEDMVGGKMYLTGGVGSRHRGEMFGQTYDLPNLAAYAETCAAAANVFWNHRLLALDGDARYADVLERALYNGFLAGVSLDGERFFYVNPLACTGEERRDPWYDWARGGPHRRRQFYSTCCCPPNVVRLLAGLPGYFYGVGPRGVWVHLYGTSSLEWGLPDGHPVALRQQTDYPWDGAVDIELFRETEGEFSIFARVPGWCASAEAAVNGNEVGGEPRPGSYLEVRRRWEPGDVLELRMEMPPRWTESHPRVWENTCRLAVERGPLVYCLEGVDNPAADLFGVRAGAESPLTTRHRPDMLGGITTVETTGAVPTGDPEARPLYRPAGSGGAPDLTPVDLTAVPYCTWANRGPAEMTVWMLGEDQWT